MLQGRFHIESSGPGRAEHGHVGFAAGELAQVGLGAVQIGLEGNAVRILGQMFSSRTRDCVCCLEEDNSLWSDPTVAPPLYGACWSPKIVSLSTIILVSRRCQWVELNSLFDNKTIVARITFQFYVTLEGKKMINL